MKARNNLRLQFALTLNKPLPLSSRGETPKQILERLAREFGCEPRQVADKVIRMLEERAKAR
jgi:hypothetical protein